MTLIRTISRNLYMYGLLLLCVSCSVGSPYISPQERKMLLADLERKIDEKLGGAYSQSVLKFDLLGMGEQNTVCNTASLYALFDAPVISREEYKQKIRQIEQRIDLLSQEHPSLLQAIYRKTEEKTSNLTKVIHLAKLKPKDFQKNTEGVDLARADVLLRNGAVGGPFVAAPESAVTDDTSAILSNFAVFSNQQALAKELEKLNKLDVLTSALPLSNPLPGGVTTSTFRIRKDPFNGRRANHEGIDLAGEEGAKIYSAAAGIVTFSGRKRGYGNMVVIDHGFGITTRYAHLKLIIAKKGEKVSTSQAIGIQGETGRATAPHLHYEVRFNNRPQNPSTFLKLGKICSATL